MRILRTFLLMASGLFISFAAAAQSAPLSAANQDMLSWMLRVLLGAICLVALWASIALLTAAATRTPFRPQPAAASTPEAAPLPAPVAAAPAPVVAAPVAAPAAAPASPVAQPLVLVASAQH